MAAALALAVSSLVSAVCLLCITCRDIQCPRNARECECAICLEPVAVGDTILVLPCSHIYHRRCLASWLAIKPTCPLCITDLTGV